LFRLKVITLKLPPLRERKEDIFLLAQHFLTKYSQTMQKPLKGFTQEASKLLSQYDWPGNVRELENTIERGVTLAEPGVKYVHEDLLPDEIRAAQQPQVLFAGKDLSLTEAVETLERTMVVDALQKFNGNRTKAAESLGLSRRGLLNKIERYGLDA
ncbi:MAG: helix-turn-helix domain-containing protein, partial [bacterium]